MLQIELEVFDCGEEKMACFPTGEGAISSAPDFIPSENGPIVNLNCENDLDGVGYYFAKPSPDLSPYVKQYWGIENCLNPGEEHVQPKSTNKRIFTPPVNSKEQ